MEPTEQKLLKALQQQDWALAQRLIDDGAPIGSRSLHDAIYKNQLELAKLLIEKGAPLDAVDSYGNTPLHEAINKGQWELAKLLIKKVASVDAVDSYGSSLNYAINKDQWELAKLLIEKGASVDAVDRYGYTPLHYAINKNQWELAKLLIEKGAPLDAADKEGKKTPLHYAINKDQLELAKLLIEKGASVDAVDRYGYTPLHYAINKDQLELAKLLIEKGAPLDAVKEIRTTPLHYAINKGKPELAKLLIAKGGCKDTKFFAEKLRIVPYKPEYSEIAFRDGQPKIYKLEDLASYQRWKAKQDDEASAGIPEIRDFATAHLGILFEPLREEKIQFEGRETLEDLREATSLFDRTPQLYRAVEAGQWDDIIALSKKVGAGHFMAEDFIARPFSFPHKPPRPNVIELLTAQGRLGDVFTKDVWNISNIDALQSVMKAIPPLYLEHQVGIKRLQALVNEVCEGNLQQVGAIHHALIEKVEATAPPALEAEPDPQPHSHMSEVELRIAAEAQEKFWAQKFAQPNHLDLNEDGSPGNRLIDASRDYRERLEWKVRQLEARVAELEDTREKAADARLAEAGKDWTSRITRGGNKQAQLGG